MIDSKVRIGGVPEHFNYPWYLLLKSKELQASGINLRWQDFNGGTGAMVESLINREIDLGLMLTEGIIKAICDGAPLKLIQYFVASPLIWGVHTHYSSGIKTPGDLKRLTGSAKGPINVAISRFGSGSHLMAHLYIKSLGLKPESVLNFREVGGLDQGLNELRNGKSHLFLWEKFTTQPYLETLECRRIDQYPTPWPCFVLAGHKDFIQSQEGVLNTIKKGIERHTALMLQRPELIPELAHRYDQKQDAIAQWLKQTRWSHESVDHQVIEQVQAELQSLGLIQNVKPVSDFF